MLLERVLEPEVMDSPDEALAYDSMDHDDVNRKFVDDMLTAIAAQVDTLPAEPTRDDEGVFLDFLDLGTGTAQIPIELCERDERFRCLAIDMAESMLEIGRRNLEMAHFADRVVLELEDAKSLPYEADRFSVVFSNSIIHHIPEPAHAIAEAVRVTKPGGMLFFRDLIRPPDDAAVKRLVYTYARNETDEQRQLLDASLRAALSLQEVRDLVSANGFDPHGVTTTSDRHWTWVGSKQ